MQQITGAGAPAPQYEGGDHKDVKKELINIQNTFQSLYDWVHNDKPIDFSRLEKALDNFSRDLKHVPNKMRDDIHRLRENLEFTATQANEYKNGGVGTKEALEATTKETLTMVDQILVKYFAPT